MRTLLALAVLVTMASVAWAQDVPVNVYIDGKLQRYNPSAVVRAGTTYVPLRQGATSLGLDVKWMPELNAAQVCDDVSCVIIPKSDGIIIRGSLFLPLRTMGEVTGARVTWDGSRRAVMIQSAPAIRR